MSAAAVNMLVTAYEPWTEESFLALPESRQLELLDGSLLVSPSPANLHQRVLLNLCLVLIAVAPPLLEVMSTANVRLGTNRILVPDIAVIANFDVSAVVNPAADVRLVVEITSPGDAYIDRGLKPQLYAEAGIPHYLRVELAHEPPAVLVFALRGDRYVETVSFGPDQVAELADPFPVRFDLAELIAR
jgi:Uma2 family endonuclease